MLVQNIALVSEESTITSQELANVAAALQKQVTRDFGPAWSIDATVSPFATLNGVPAGYWPIIVMDDINAPDAEGYHEDQNGQPFALIKFDTNWSLTASHECLEMIADPFGKHMVPGPSLQNPTDRVQYLVEVCDPCEDAQFAYTVNGVVVSDFYTPRFFDPVAGAVQYDFTGAIKTPRQVLPGGYISWLDPVTNHIMQQVYLGSIPEIRDLGPSESSSRNLREWVDSKTRVKKVLDERALSSERFNTLGAYQDGHYRSSAAYADTLRTQIRRIKAGAA